MKKMKSLFHSNFFYIYLILILIIILIREYQRRKAIWDREKEARDRLLREAVEDQLFN
jgi:hypothetical protein